MRADVSNGVTRRLSTYRPHNFRWSSTRLPPPEGPRKFVRRRVQDGVGQVVDVNVGLENIGVAWEETGDRTVWTRAGSHGLDVVVSQA